MRKRAAEMMEKVTLTFAAKDGGEEVRLRPYAYIPNLWSQIEQLLEVNCIHD